MVRRSHSRSGSRFYCLDCNRIFTWCIGILLFKNKENKEKFPKFCGDCAFRLPEDLGVSTCPNCGETRQKLTSGKPAQFCVCKYNYITGTVSSQKGSYSYQKSYFNFANKI